MKYHRIIDDIIEEALQEHFKKKFNQQPKKTTSNSKLGFFEGLVVAYMAQILYGPLTKLAEIYFAAHGVH